jgi:putative ABC transport system substrate-binding protein
MDRRVFIAGTFALFAVPLAAEAQPAGKMVRIARLDAGSATARPDLWEAFSQGLRDLGYIEGRNVIIESRWGDEKPDRLPDLAAELVRLHPDLIVTAGAPAALAAKQATTTIPIILVGVGDPVPLGLVASLARPGGNITGLSNLAIELAGKRVGLLNEVAPRVSRVAVLWDQANPAAEFNVKEAEAAAASLGLTLQLFPVQGPNEFSSSFSAMVKGQVGALIVGPSPMFFGQRRQLAGLAVKSRLPTVFTAAEYAGLVASCPTGRTMRICTDARHPSWTGSSRAPGPPTCPSSSRRSSSWSSI